MVNKKIKIAPWWTESLMQLRGRIIQISQNKCFILTKKMLICVCGTGGKLI